jgi:site-specific DNA recombinase
MATETPKTKYRLYCRKSTESEDRQVLSIESQIDEGKELTEKLGIKLADITSESKSAKIAGKRDVFNQNLEDIENGVINALVVWHADRLSRNAIDTARLIDLMDRNKLIEIVTPTQTFKNTPFDKFLLSFQCSQAKMENDKKGIDVARGLKKKAKNGVYPSQVRLGYRNDKATKTIITDVELFPLIRRMWDLMLTGNITPPKILDVANNEWSFRTPKGKKMSRSTIYNIFTDPFFYGRYEYPKGSGNWYDGTHEKMITEEEFDKVQFLLGRKGKPRPKAHIFDFTGMMRCGECGAMITAETKIKRQQNGNVHTYVYYHCTKRKNPTCSQGSIEEKDLKKQIISEINKIEIPPEFRTFGMKWFRKENAKEVDSRSTILNAQQKAYNAVVAKIDGLTDMRAAQEITPEEFAEKRSQLLLEKKKLSGLLNDTDARIDKWIKTGDEMLDFIENAKAKFKSGTIQTRRGILSTLGSDLIIKEKMLSISIEKSLFPLKSVSKELESIKERLEPLNTVDKQRDFEALCLQNPVVLRCLV